MESKNAVKAMKLMAAGIILAPSLAMADTSALDALKATAGSETTTRAATIAAPSAAPLVTPGNDPSKDKAGQTVDLESEVARIIAAHHKDVIKCTSLSYEANAQSSWGVKKRLVGGPAYWCSTDKSADADDAVFQNRPYKVKIFLTGEDLKGSSFAITKYKVPADLGYTDPGADVVYTPTGAVVDMLDALQKAEKLEGASNDE
jgi:hypothetical protein